MASNELALVLSAYSCFELIRARVCVRFIMDNARDWLGTRAFPCLILVSLCLPWASFPNVDVVPVVVLPFGLLSMLQGMISPGSPFTAFEAGRMGWQVLEVAGDKVAPELTLAGWAALLQVSVALLFLPQFKHIWRWLLLLAFGASAYAGYVYPGLRSGYGWHVAGFASMAAHFTLRRWDRPMPLEAAPHEE